MISWVIQFAKRLKAPSEVYFDWRKKQRISYGRYFSDDKLNAFHLAMETGRYRWREGVAEIDRLNLMSAVSHEFRYKFNKISWSSFSEALLLFDLYNDTSYRSHWANLTDWKCKNSGISRRARRLIRRLKYRRRESEKSYFRRINRSKAARTAILVSLAYDLNPKFLREPISTAGTFKFLEAGRTLAQLKIEKNTIRDLKILSERMGHLADDLKNSKKPSKLRMSFERSSGWVDSRLAYVFALIAVRTDAYRDLIRHDVETCPKCEETGKEFSKGDDYRGHIILVAGKAAYQIAMASSFYWDDSELLFERDVLFHQFVKVQPDGEKTWYKLEFDFDDE